jgi:hypothetical protein
VDVREIGWGGMDWRALVNIVINLRVALNELLNYWQTLMKELSFTDLAR